MNQNGAGVQSAQDCAICNFEMHQFMQHRRPMHIQLKRRQKIPSRFTKSPCISWVVAVAGWLGMYTSKNERDAFSPFEHVTESTGFWSC